ncbi:MAG: phytanoyl-CoA dioxygenase family protein [Alphaproteobacteria bacterium]|nr:phytanoyl-CoA dioxygenase family protein [Alphaproteobacteria bacterium]
MLPLWSAQLLSGVKSFERNDIIGSRWLNEHGLHTTRVSLAHALANARRRRLAHLVSPADRESFERDGFVVRRDFLPSAQFAMLRDQIKNYRGPLREITEGDTVMRKIALDPATLAQLPSLDEVLRSPVWRGLIRYIGSRDAEPVVWIQSILQHAAVGPSDPQTAMHADTFHPTVKAWLFLTDVAEDSGPFTYVPGSHRLTPQRLEWERRMSVSARRSPNAENRQGSFRIEPRELRALGLPDPISLAVPANTLVVADTFGFHARGTSTRQSLRVEVWAYGRRSPFIPWTAFDFWTGAALARRSLLGFQLGDLSERLGLKPHRWRARRGVSAFDPA